MQTKTHFLIKLNQINLEIVLGCNGTRIASAIVYGKSDHLTIAPRIS